MSSRPTPIVVPTPFRIGPVNCYLVEADTLTLVDAGPNAPESLAGLEQGLAALGRQLQDIDLVLLTHQHYDHVGLAAAIRERSGATVAAHELLARFLALGDEGLEAEDLFAEQIMRLHGVDEETIAQLRATARRYRKYGSSPVIDRVLHDGDVLELGGVDLRVALRPGHSPTDTIFVDEEQRRALVGDHLIGHISSNPILYGPSRGSTDPYRRPPALIEYLESMQATLELGLDELLPGHGEPIPDPRALVEHRLRRHHERKERIFDELAGGPLTARQLAGALWPELPTDQVYLAISEVLGHVDLLLVEGRVTETATDGLMVIGRV